MPVHVSASALWLPVLLSAVLVFLVSSLIHMVLPWHKNDYPRLAKEDAVLDALRPLQIPPGDYFVPRPASRQDMRSPAFLEKFARGPVVLFTVLPGVHRMGRQLAQWFVFILVIVALVALMAASVLRVGAGVHAVFHLTTLAAWLGFAAALWPLSIWYGRGWNITLKATLDGLIYALITAGVFAWLWPR